jgi:hypothetical protein
MKCSYVVFAILALAFGNTNRTECAVLTFDFSSGPGSGFTFTDDSGLFSINAAGPGLRISKPADDGSFNTTDWVSGAIQSKFEVVGNFTVTVDFALYDFPTPAGNGLNESILVASLGGDDFFGSSWFDVLKMRSHDFNLIDSWLSVDRQTGYGLGYVESNLMTGRYRISRVGSTVIGSYAESGSSDFTELGQTSGFSGPVRIGLSAAQGEGVLGASRSTTSLDISFNNLIVDADLIVPEPSTIVLLGMSTFSLLTYAWRRRRQLL